MWGNYMKKSNTGKVLIDEEKRTLKWFLLLFYIILIGYDSFYYYFLPNFITHKKIGLPSNFSYSIYIVILLLIPVSKFLRSHNKGSKIKYVYFISYILITLLADIVTYYGSDQPFSSGNAVEVFLVLFSPLFINSRYFWLVSLGLIIKYLLTGIILKTTYVSIPILLIVILSIMAFILLSRFQGFVTSIKNSYDAQLEGIVKSVIATLELKDPYTKGHSERVAQYALILARATGRFSVEELKSFNYACLLHDIGKVHIPDKILMKPGKLTNDEFNVIKLHPVVGANAVKDVEGLKNSIAVIRNHHERWDGLGYPDQLKGEKIPVLARITAIADSFDAMTSSRSYRSALSVDEAYKRVIEGQGSQFDPLLVDEFKKVFPFWVKFHKEYCWALEDHKVKEVRK
jgi:hypothetical protein